MTSSKPPLRSVPPPAGSQNRPANAYARFIPREELADFEAWTPDVFGALLDAAARPGRAAAEGSSPAGAPDSAHVAGDAPEVEAAPVEPTPAEWAEQVVQAREQGYHDGYRDGLQALEAAKRQYALQVSGQIAHLVEAFDTQIGALESRMAQALIETAVTLARQVVRSELQQRPDCVTQVAREAVGALVLSARQLRLRLNPQDVKLVEIGAGEALRAREVLLQPDPRVAAGGCVVESDLGQVDASVETRWAQAAAVFNVALDWNADAADAVAPARAAEAAADVPAAGSSSVGEVER